MSDSTRYLSIDEEGYFKSDEGLRMDDPAFAHSVFKNVERAENGAWVSKAQDNTVFLEPFDEVFVAHRIEKKTDGQWQITAPYDWSEAFSLETLTLDPWDRIHGYTHRGIAFVLSRSAQADFFNQFDEFTDDSITIDGVTYVLENWLRENEEAQTEDFWGERYVEQNTPWDQNKENQTLSHFLPQLKLNRSHVGVFGCGRGHDANFFANAGHLVKGFDLSHEAVDQAKKLYTHKDLQFEQANVLKLHETHYEVFDVVYEHTLFCAISPSYRNLLIDNWRKCLRPNGWLIGTFFCFDRPQGPPFGGSEWELKRRLYKSFDFLYWTRSRNSTERRRGTELFVVAQKK